MAWLGSFAHLWDNYLSQEDKVNILACLGLFIQYSDKALCLSWHNFKPPLIEKMSSQLQNVVLLWGGRTALIDKNQQISIILDL